MAATDATPVPIKNQAYRHYFAIRDNTGSLVTTWAGQDSEKSLDGATMSDCTNEAVEIATNSGTGYIDLTATEMNTSATVLKVTVTNTDALPYVVTLFPVEAGDIPVDTVQVGGQTASATGAVDFDDLAAIEVDTTSIESKLDTVDGIVDSILVDTGTTLPATLSTIDGIVDTILIDTNELQTNQGQWATATGFSTHDAAAVVTALGTGSSLTSLFSAANGATLDGKVDTVDTVVDSILAAVSALNDLDAAAVNAEIVDALATDTYAEPGQGTPAATASLAEKINYLYKNWRNVKIQTPTTFSLFNDDGVTVDQKAAVSDDGTTATKNEIVTGP